MLQIFISKSTKGTEVQMTSADTAMLKRVYRVFLKAALKGDKCTKTLYAGPVRSGEFSYLVHCPGLSYEQACLRVAQIMPDGVHSYSQSLIGE